MYPSKPSQLLFAQRQGGRLSLWSKTTVAVLVEHAVTTQIELNFPGSRNILKDEHSPCQDINRSANPPKKCKKVDLLPTPVEPYESQV